MLDLPGTYSLSPQSLDEQIARDVLLTNVQALVAHKGERNGRAPALTGWQAHTVRGTIRPSVSTVTSTSVNLLFTVMRTSRT